MTKHGKQYDRAYFDRWYRNPRTRIDSADSLTRKVRLAVSAAEYLLGRRVRSVLDVGCGEGRWRTVLRQLRPTVRYVGVDASPYVVRRFGRRRDIRMGSVHGLAGLRIASAFDLVVCADVLQYVSDADLAPGLRQIRARVGGVAYIEAFSREDRMEGDAEEWHVRTAAEYARLFRRAGLTHCGLYCWVDRRRLRNVNAFERTRWT